VGRGERTAEDSRAMAEWVRTATVLSKKIQRYNTKVYYSEYIVVAVSKNLL
jgi:hypothetical protein